jgi:hypothetical protein
LIPMTSVHGIRVFGGTFPAQIWHNFMLAAMAGKPVREFRIPNSAMITVMIDPVTGLLAAPWCPGEPQRMLRELAPRQYCPPPGPAPAPIPSVVQLTPSPGPTGKNGSPSPAPTETGKGGGGHGEPTPEPSGGNPQPTPTPTP